MRATAVARVPLLLLLALLLVVGHVRYKVYVDGVIEGKVGPDGVDLCVEAVDHVEEQDPVADLGVKVVDLCVRTTFCAGAGLDSMTQRVCAPID